MEQKEIITRPQELSTPESRFNELCQRKLAIDLEVVKPKNIKAIAN